MTNSCPPNQADELRAENKRLKSALFAAHNWLIGARNGEDVQVLSRGIEFALDALHDALHPDVTTAGELIKAENEAIREENRQLKRIAHAAQDLETYLINNRWFLNGGEPALSGFPTGELAMLSDALDTVDLEPEHATTAASQYDGPPDELIGPELSDV